MEGCRQFNNNPAIRKKGQHEKAFFAAVFDGIGSASWAM
jgi:hypothetical protein